VGGALPEAGDLGELAADLDDDRSGGLEGEGKGTI
jgi:hypothetical protein